MFKINSSFLMPTYGHIGDSGCDIYCPKRLVFDPLQRIKVATGIRLEMPLGMEAQIRSRSGLAAQGLIVPTLGTIDSNYRGEVSILLWNISDDYIVVNRGDRVAQMVFCLVERPVGIPCLEGDRGEGGFGSTGK